MLEKTRQKLYRNRGAVFAAGMVVGPIVVYAVFHKRIYVHLNKKRVTLIGYDGILNWLAENNYSVDFDSPSGTFQLMPPKK